MCLELAPSLQAVVCPSLDHCGRESFFVLLSICARVLTLARRITHTTPLDVHRSLSDQDGRDQWGDIDCSSRRILDQRVKIDYCARLCPEWTYIALGKAPMCYW